MIKKVKKKILRHGQDYVINDLDVEEIVGAFYENEFQKSNLKEFRIGKSNQEKRQQIIC